MTITPDAKVKVWDWPLRIWHWAFAACLCTLLYTGLAGEIALLQWHMRTGVLLLGLLLFRLFWGFWGGDHARWPGYRVTPRQLLSHFRGGRVDDPHTAPGRALALAVLILAAAQAGTGLFANDDIFNEGPLARYVSDGLSDQLTWLHHQIFIAVIALASIHLTAHAVYGARRDPTPLAMFTGRKRTAVQPTPDYWWRALLTAALAAAIVGFGGLWPN